TAGCTGVIGTPFEACSRRFEVRDARTVSRAAARIPSPPRARLPGFPSAWTDHALPFGRRMSSAHRASLFARLLLAGLAVAAAAGLVAGERARSPAVVLRLGHSLDTTHPVHLGIEFFARELLARSDGRLRVQIYPNSQLGSEREMIELVQVGALDMVKTSTSPLEGFTPVMGLFSGPYVFRDEAHLWEFLDGPDGRQLLRASEPQRLRGICYYDAG